MAQHPSLGEAIERLAATIESRRSAAPDRSWSAQLIGNPSLAARKVAEEALEMAFAALAEDRSAVVAESADLIYHWLALLAAKGVSTAEVAQELASRAGRSGLEEKASRPDAS